MFDLLPIILACAPSVHIETMYPLVKTESGFNPFAIALVKESPLERQPKTIEEAEKIIDRLEERGANFSVGLGQINKINFKHYGVSAKDLFDPCLNLQISEKILNDCYSRSPNAKIGQALSCYYSGNFKTGYTKDIAGLPSYVERIINNYKPEKEIKSIIIPSIKQEINEIKRVSESSTKKSKTKQVEIKTIKKNSNKHFIKNHSSKEKQKSSKSIF